MEAISEENETEVAGPPPAPPAPPAPAPAPPTAPAETVPSAVREQANEANDALEADEDHHEQHIAHVEETRDSFRELAQAKVPPRRVLHRWMGMYVTCAACCSWDESVAMYESPPLPSKVDSPNGGRSL